MFQFVSKYSILIATESWVAPKSWSCFGAWKTSVDRRVWTPSKSSTPTTTRSTSTSKQKSTRFSTSADVIRLPRLGNFFQSKTIWYGNQNKMFNLLVPQKPQVFILKFENEQWQLSVWKIKSDVGKYVHSFSYRYCWKKVFLFFIF